MISLIVPTSRERDNIEILLTRLQQVRPALEEALEVLVVDDRSDDGTAACARDVLARSMMGTVIETHLPSDLAAAVLAGVRQAHGELIGVMDADLSHPPELLPHLVRAIRQGAQVAIASRYVLGGGTDRWPWYRRALSRVGNLLARPLVPVADATSGYFVCEASLFKPLSIRMRGFKVLLQLLVEGCVHRVAEVPYVFADRRYGTSKLGGRALWSYLIQLLRLYEHRWRHPCPHARRVMTQRLEGHVPSTTEMPRPPSDGDRAAGTDGGMAQGAVHCDLILVTWDHLDYTRSCVESLLRHTTVPYRLIIVDNGSAQDTVMFLDALEAAHPGRVVTVKLPQNLGWVKAVNEGLRRSQAPYVCLLNNDLIVAPGWLERMLAVAEAEPRIGLVNPTYNRHGVSLEEFQHEAGRQDRAGIPYVELNECNGACLLIRRSVLSAIGGLDEAYGLGGMEDSDYSRRAEVAGFRCARANRAYVFHWENVSCDIIPDYWGTIRRENEALFHRRWGVPKQLSVVLTEPDQERLVQQLHECLALARLGVQMSIWALLPTGSPLVTTDGRWRLGLAEHTNLKWVVWPHGTWRGVHELWGIGLSTLAAARAWSRRWKRPHQRVHAFIVPSRVARGWLGALRWLHGCPRYPGFTQCPLIGRELQQVQC